MQGVEYVDALADSRSVLGAQVAGVPALDFGLPEIAGRERPDEPWQVVELSLVDGERGGHAPRAGQHELTLAACDARLVPARPEFFETSAVERPPDRQPRAEDLGLVGVMARLPDLFDLGLHIRCE